MLPLLDHNPVHRVPVVTYLLLALNVLIFLTEPVAGQLFGPGTVAEACATANFFDEYGAIPKELVDNTQLPPQQYVVETGAGTFRCPPPDAGPAPVLTVFTAMFLHGGWLHLLGNLLFLWVFGNNVEDRVGRLRFLLGYLACGVLATYAYALLYADSTDALVGASGAIAGVLGAYLVFYPQARVTSLLPFLFFIPVRLPAWVVLGSWFVLQYLYAAGTGVAGGAGVAYAAHVAGFVAGFLVAAALRAGRVAAPR